MKGFIGFFDILGYRNFLENNSSIETCEKVLALIANSGRDTHAILETALGLVLKVVAKGQETEDFLKNIDWLVFSDTIVFTIPLSELPTPLGALEPLFSAFRSAIALNYASMLHKAMFDNGLPIRGVLHYGEFVRNQNCLAGKGIVESYRILERIDLSCVAVSLEADSAFEEIEKRFSALDLGLGDISFATSQLAKLRMQIKIPYLVPMRDGSESILSIINWNERSVTDISDIDQWVHEKFWAHSKTIPKEAERKLSNTIKFVRFLKTQNAKADSKQLELYPQRRALERLNTEVTRLLEARNTIPK